MIRSQSLKLPVGDVPDWELDDGDGEHTDLKSPAESYVILQSLRQSRDKWLRSMFPKFSSRGRGGRQPDVVPPPHTIYSRGKCTLQIGPHFFMDTTVFEVHYRPLPVTVSQPTSFMYHSTSGSSSSQADHKTQTQLPQTSVPAAEPNALFPSISASLPTSPGLISQVNAAATSNPTLANMLQLAASGQATSDQLKALGLLIQSLATSPATANATLQTSAQGTQPSSAPLSTASTATQQYQYQTVLKDFDVVIEFRETPSDRWIFPRGPATCEFASASGDSGSIGDLTLSTIIPFPSMESPHDLPGTDNGASTELPTKQVVVFYFKMANSFIWDTFTRWVGPKEKMEENRKILMEIEPSEQKFLAHRLPEGPQLTQIQNAALGPYAMKPIKPSTESGKSKRRSAPRKSTHDPPGFPAAKRKRQAQQKSQIAPTEIACYACGQANVPLIMGGRYCRPCVEGGRVGDTSASQVNKVNIPAKSSTHDSVEASPKSTTPPPQPAIPDNVFHEKRFDVAVEP